MAHPILSILVITHNQRELLKRCLDSVLGQNLNVPFEVIVSDDRSDDGTAEYITELQEQLINGKRQITNLQELVYTRCNSNDCDPKNVSERCGWNKLNAYNHAKGECFVNVDADDFLRSNDIYQAQYDMLLAHPECSMCMQDVWSIREGEPIDNGATILSWLNFESHHVFSPYEIIDKYRMVNPCYMIRRHPEIDCAGRYGKLFDDSVITLHHLQFGPCVYIQRADYVWVRHPDSITMSLSDEDKLFEYHLLPLHHAQLIPELAPDIMKAGLKTLIHLFKKIAENHYQWNLTNRTQLAFREYPGYLYRVFSTNNPTMWDKQRLRYIRFVLILYRRFRLTNWQYLYGLLIDRRLAKTISWNQQERWIANKY